MHAAALKLGCNRKIVYALTVFAIGYSFALLTVAAYVAITQQSRGAAVDNFLATAPLAIDRVRHHLDASQNWHNNGSVVVQDVYGCQAQVRLSGKPAVRIAPSRFGRRMNKLFNIDDYLGEELFKYFDYLGISFRREKIHRKAWEWATGLYALELLGKITTDAVGLELAAGVEPVMFYLSNKVKAIHAGDVYGTGDFASSTAFADFPQNTSKYAKIPFNPRRLHIHDNMDGRNLSFFSNQTVDFVMSFSSIEHFGGEVAAKQSMLEQARVLKPGGVSIVVTELIVTPHSHSAPEFGFAPFQLHQSLVLPAATAGLHLIEDADFSVTSASLPYFTSGEVNTSCYKVDPHVFLCQKFGRPEWDCYGSIMLVFQKI